MAPIYHLPLLLLFLLLLVPSLSLSSSVHSILPKYGLPVGLLPSSVTNYTFSPSTGAFFVSLPKPCYVQFEYLVYYETEITGVLKYGSITELKGVQVQRFWIWFGVDEIKVDLPPLGWIYFVVGVVSKRLDVDQFNEIPTCRDQGWANSLKDLLKMPPPLNDDVPMLVTE